MSQVIGLPKISKWSFLGSNRTLFGFESSTFRVELPAAKAKNGVKSGQIYPG